MKILIIDDNKLATEVNTLLLQAIHPTVEVVKAENFAQALAFKFHPLTAVMSDLCMPDIEPLELVDRLSRTFSQVPIVFMSSLGSHELDYKIIERRGYKIINKCAPMHTMRSELQALLRNPSFVEMQ